MFAPVMAIARHIQLVRFAIPVKDRVLTEQRYYWISLGNGYRIRCESRKDALRVLAEINIILDNRLSELHQCAALLLSAYYRLWRYLREPQCRKAMSYIMDFERAAGLAVDRCQGADGNFFTFQHMATASDALSTLASFLLKHCRPGDTTGRELQDVEARQTGIRLFLSHFPAGSYSELLSEFIRGRIQVSQYEHYSDRRF